MEADIALFPKLKTEHFLKLLGLAGPHYPQTIDWIDDIFEPIRSIRVGTGTPHSGWSVHPGMASHGRLHRNPPPIYLTMHLRILCLTETASEDACI